MSDEEGAGGAETVRRGQTGEDRSARDWVGSEEPEAPEGAEVAGKESAAGEQDDPAVAGSAAEGSAAEDSASEISAAEGSAVEGSDEAAAAAAPGDAASPAAAGDDTAEPAADGDPAPDATPPAAADAATSAAGEAAEATQDDAAEAAQDDAAEPVPTVLVPPPVVDPLVVPPLMPVPVAVEEPPAEEPPRQIVRATGPPRRPPLIVQGLWPALLAAGLVAATAFGLLPLTVAVLGVQVFLVLGALALLDAPASGGAFLVATGTIVVADAVVLSDDGSIGGLAGVAGLGLVASLLHQLIRKGRSRVTESLADTLVVIVVASAAACLLALRQVEGGEQVLLVSLAAAGGVLLAGRIGDTITPRPMLAAGSTRGWPGLLLGLGAGVAVAVLVANADVGDGNLPLRSAALLGLVVASTVATADLAVDLGAAELRAGWRDARRVAALRPTALLLPYAVLGPVALLAGRLVLA